MHRVWLAILVAAAIGTEAVAQEIIWNPNSPRAQRDLRVHPPPPQPLPGQLGETIEAERWGTVSGQIRQPTWGTIGGYGWSGSFPPTGVPSGVR
jgi:hypothetical protein